MLVKTFCMLGLGALAISQTPKTATDAIENVRWLRAPDPEAVAQYTPYFASLIGVPGRVQLRCVAMFEGTPQNCQIVSVSPEGLGFENAGRLVAATGVVRPMMVDGTVVPATFNFTVTFRAEELPVDPDPKYDGPEPSANALKMARTIVEAFAENGPEEPWQETVDALDSDRREPVLAWLNELFPVDVNEEIRISALGLARSVSEAELSVYLETGTVPDEPPADKLAAAYGGTTSEDIKALETLRARYCARWPCEIERD